MTTFFFGFHLSGFVFPEFQQFPSKKKKASSLWFSQFHPSFLRTGARYILDEGIVFDQAAQFQVCNIHSMRFCVSAEHTPALFRTRALVLCQLLADNIVPVLSASLACLFHTHASVCIKHWWSTAQGAMEIAVTLFPDATLIHFAWR